MFPDLTLLAFLFLSAIGLVGSLMGFVTTRVLGLDWSARTGLADALVTIVTCIAFAWLLSVQQREDVMVPISTSAVGVMVPIFSTAAAVLCGGVLRHVGRRLLGRGTRAPAP